MKKPSEECLDRYEVNIKGDTVFASNARLLQSIYRESHITKDMGTYTPKDSNGKHRKLGNLLPNAIAINKGANFLTSGIYDVVKNAINHKSCTHALISEPRIWTNLLSSQPMCFNLFGELVKDNSLATRVFRELFPNLIEDVTQVDFEYSPGRGDTKYLKDKTAFDAFVKFQDTNGKQGFIGIETKYCEHMRDKSSASGKPDEARDKYVSIARESGVFRLNSDTKSKLLDTSIHQLWRGHLLALRMLRVDKQTYAYGFYMFIYPQDNVQCSYRLSKYYETLISDDFMKNKIKSVTLEQIVDVLSNNSNSDWIQAFKHRYLGFNTVNLINSNV
jgi:hypothetical protein